MVSSKEKLYQIIKIIISARVNLRTSQIASSCTVILYLAFLFRILFGSFTHSGVVVFHYLTRATSVSFTTMLTFSRVLKTFLILDFHRMSLVPEHSVMICMHFVTVASTLVYLLQEAVVRKTRGLPNYGRWSVSIYLGKVLSGDC